MRVRPSPGKPSPHVERSGIRGSLWTLRWARSGLGRLGLLPLKGRDLPPQLVVLDLGVNRGGMLGDAPQHGALIGVEVGARGVRPVERERKAAERICRR